MKVGEKIGRFRVERALAQGGMGAIYIAADSKTGERVALKTVNTKSSGHVISLRREIRALLSIEHPALVAIVDHGLYDPVPWFAMEYIEGASMRLHFSSAYATEMVDVDSATTLHVHETPTTQLVEESEWPARTPAPDEQIRLLGHMAAICRGVGYMHGHGLVHRDLKPENIILRERDGRPILVDFGIASRSAGGRREHATQLGHVAGTPAYMAPEQARNLWVDARADMYAIGCILYEIVTGRPPFCEGSSIEIMMSHSFEEVPAIDEDIDPRLEALIMRLLSKAPDERPGYADLVAREIEQILGIPAPQNFPDNPVHVYRPRFVGRDEEMNACRQRLDELARNEGSTTMILGAPGSGKTRFALELKRIIDANPAIEGLLIEVGTDETKSGDLPFRTTLSEIADRCRERGPLYTRQVLGEDGAALAVLHPEILDLPGMESFDAPPPLPTALETARRTHAWARVLLRLSGGKPMAFVVDQIGPRLIKYLVTLKKAIRYDSLPIAVFATSGAGEDEFREIPQSDLVRLRPLDDQALDVVVKTMLALDESPRELTEFLVERSRGLPAMVAEYLTLATEKGLLERARDGAWEVVAEAEDWDQLPLPERLGGLVTERLRSLPERSHALMRLIAVYGSEISIEMLAELVDSPTELEGLDALLKAGILIPREEKIAFAENSFRQAALDLAPNEALERCHLKIAEIMNRSDDRDIRFESARHLVAAGKKEQARQRILGLVETLSNSDPARTFNYLTYFFELDPPEDKETLSAIVRYCRAAHGTGRASRTLEQARWGTELASEFESIHDYCSLATGLAYGLAARGELAEAKALVDEIEELEPEDANDRALIDYTRGAIAMVERDWSIARTHFERAVPLIATDTTRPRASTILHINLTNCLSHLMRYEEALASLEKTEKLAREARADDLLAYVHGNRAALTFTYLFDLDEAKAQINEAIALHRQVHDRNGVSHAVSLRAHIHYQNGDIEAASEDFAEGVSLFELADNLPESQRNRAYYALTSAGLGDSEGSMNLLEEAWNSDPIYDSVRLLVAAIGARIARRSGDYRKAEEWLDRIDSEKLQSDDPQPVILAEAERAFLASARGHEFRMPETPDGDLAIETKAELDALEAVRDGVETIHGEPVERYEREWPGHSNA